MDKRSLSGQELREFIGNLGVMDRLAWNGSKDNTSKGAYSVKEVRKHGIDLHFFKPDRQNQCKVEGMISEMRKKCLRNKS